MADVKTTPADIEVVEHNVNVPHSGTMKVYVQGNLEERQGKTIFVSCHDVGTNYKSWFPFLCHSSMSGVRERSIFLHICFPGQESNAPDLPESFQFPSLELLGQDVAAVVEHFNVRSVIAIGEGAGANVVVRFALHHPNRLLGMILIHCTSGTAGVLEYLNNKVIGWKSGGGMSQNAYDYLITHKFGQNQDKKEPRIASYLNEMKTNQNGRNLHLFLEAYMQRTELGTLAEKLKVDALLIVGAKTAHVQQVHAMHSSMNKASTTLLVVEQCGDVLSEAPQKVARALILFAKGSGALSGVAMPGMERQRTLSGSMEEADRPRKLSLSFQRTIEKVPE